ncbi:MAG TPA: MMPL family transporter [Candidatus Omnitrophota bacterium]|nr:MMPL family transporter [Candidatus Omnitrophota bacterium]HPS36697.1 MMPL family transporter [Candidatus Omnitrophota bacterium]
MFRKLAEFIHHSRWPVLLVMGVSVLLFGMAAARLKVDPSMETLFVKKSPEYRYYQQYKEKYGSDQMIAVAMSTKDLFTKDNLKILKTVTEGIASYGQVERVISLANAMDIRHKFLGVKTLPVLDKVYKGDQSPADVRKEVLRNELYLNNIVSRDGKIGNILVYLKTGGKDPAANGVFIRQLKDYIDDFERPDVKFYMAGAPVEQYEFIRLIHRDQFVFIPAITLVLVVMTYAIYRSFACMVLSMSIVFTTLVWTLGTISALGQELNLMTSLLAPVIMIVSVINSTYLINLFFEIRPHHDSLKETVLRTIEQLGMPCFLTHFTAILGFASLAINPIPAIQSFGIYAALGTFYSYFVEIIMTTLLMPILPYRPLKEDAFDERKFFNRVIIGFLEKLEMHWKWWILILTALVLAVSVQGAQKIKVDTNIVKQMKPELPLAIATKFIDENLTGVYSLGFVFRRKDGESMVDPQALMLLDKFKTYLESEPGIPKVNSITTLIKKINEAREDEPGAYEIPQKQWLLMRYFKGMVASNDPELWKLISPDFKEVRIEARMKAIGTTDGAALEERIREYLKNNLSDFFEYKLTGNVVLLGKIAKSLIHEQTRSFAFAFGSILIVIILIFRSIPMGFLAAIPNLFPILAVYGIMGFMGIELSTATAMIASIVLGLVVDASIQFLYRFRLEFEHRYHYLQALHHTYRNMGNSMVVSTLILVVGFAASVFASFRITVHFGILTSLTIFLALICSLLVLPVFLVMVKPFGPQRLFKRKVEGKDALHAQQTPPPEV